MTVNLARSLEAMADGQPILHAVIGRHSNDYDSSVTPSYINKLLPWGQARAILDYEYDNGYGGADCHPVYAWTKDRVLFVHEYDGATGINWVPRDPTYFGGADIELFFPSK